jgi:hypothetical protein
LWLSGEVVDAQLCCWGLGGMCHGGQSKAVHQRVSMRLSLFSCLLALTLQSYVLVHLLRLHLDSVLQHLEWTWAHG